MEIIAHTFDVIGKVLVSYTVIMVHHRFWKEHKIDERVFKEMHREQRLGLLGIIFILLAYFIHLFEYLLL